MNWEKQFGRSEGLWKVWLFLPRKQSGFVRALPHQSCTPRGGARVPNLVVALQDLALNRPLGNYLGAVTVLEVIRKSGDFLTRKGVESPRLQVELLLAQALGVPRLNLYLNFEQVLTETQLETMREGVRRRAGREPLQHILGSTSFCGLDLKVTPQALVPRPETELLAELAWQHLSSLSSSTPIALDFGTGTGCIALALASNCPAAEIHALDRSPEAIRLARENAVRHAVEPRIRFHTGDGFRALPQDVSFNLIVSNPPYIPTGEISSLQPEVRDHDPRVALDGGADGLDFYRTLAADAPAFLEQGGRMMLEFGDEQAEPLRGILVEHKWIVESIRADYNGKARIVTATR